jgi:hypothetical protein
MCVWRGDVVGERVDFALFGIREDLKCFGVFMALLFV